MNNRAHFRAWHRQHFSGDRIRDLVLDDLRRLALPFGVDDDLRVREIGNCVEWNVLQRENSGEREPYCCEQNNKLILQREIYDRAQHPSVGLSRPILPARESMSCCKWGTCRDDRT